MIDPSHLGQKGCPNIIPGLKAIPVWDNSEFPWINKLESCYPQIKQEFMRLRGCQAGESGIKFQVNIFSPDVIVTCSLLCYSTAVSLLM